MEDQKRLNCGKPMNALTRENSEGIMLEISKKSYLLNKTELDQFLTKALVLESSFTV